MYLQWKRTMKLNMFIAVVEKNNYDASRTNESAPTPTEGENKCGSSLLATALDWLLRHHPPSRAVTRFDSRVSVISHDDAKIGSKQIGRPSARKEVTICENILDNKLRFPVRGIIAFHFDRMGKGKYKKQKEREQRGSSLSQRKRYWKRNNKAPPEECHTLQKVPLSFFADCFYLDSNETVVSTSELLKGLMLL
ncbi:hypothetical protein TNCV_3270301 [Trichonephila clavipes]|uniref:Uncharacterized protein n=1 Tax=Trichonephila clavipes TaxID=2585209 RepID=A0A8X6S5I6_TRICX|nr:hypothetical protein TNCV_3270301 [Trichonephila clavipes]